MADGNIGTVTVLGSKRSPFVGRVLMALELKGVGYEFVQEDLQNKSELLLRSNPVHKKIPVLIHDGKPVCESLIILEYIDEAWSGQGPALLPAQPYHRALARFWAAFIDGKLGESMRGAIMNPDEELRKKHTEEASQNMGHLEEALKTKFGGKKYFAGDEVGHVDIVLASIVAHIKAVETLRNVVLLDQASTPLLYQWSLTISQTEVVKENLPDPVSVTEFFRSRFPAAAVN